MFGISRMIRGQLLFWGEYPIYFIECVQNEKKKKKKRKEIKTENSNIMTS